VHRTYLLLPNVVAIFDALCNHKQLCYHITTDSGQDGIFKTYIYIYIYICADLLQTSSCPFANVGYAYAVTLCTKVSGYIEILNLNLIVMYFRQSIKSFYMFYSYRTGSL
jgi:hypothetical protein